MLKSLRKNVSTIIKILIAVGLMYYMVHKGLFDIEAFKDLLNPFVIFVLLLITGINLVVSNYRWIVLLKSRGFDTSFKSTIPVYLIGIFFNYALPGSIGGDVVKAYYIAQDHIQRKVAAVTSVIVDRIVGLYAMVIMALVTLAMNGQMVFERTELRSIVWMTVVVFSLMSLFFAMVFSRRVRAWKMFDEYLTKIPGGKPALKIYDAFHSYRQNKMALLMTFALSFVAQIFVVLFMYFIGVVLHENIGIDAYFFAVPTGLIIMAIPISVAGVGVGQMAFLYLFQIYTQQQSVIGQTAITAFQLALLIWGLLGAFFYLKRKRPVISENPA